MSMACDSQDYMPVHAVGYDSTATTGGEIALAKFDNGTNGVSNTWEKLDTYSDNATVMDPVTVAVSSDGTVFAVGYNEGYTDNANEDYP